MTIRFLGQEDLDRLIEMRRSLWPEAMIEDVADLSGVADGTAAVIGVEVAGTLVGFADVSMRSAADGAAPGPVGYLEGWWVDPAHRRRGLGGALVGAAEEWASERDGRAMASDAGIGNDVGRAAHLGVGFTFVGEVAQYVRPIAGSDPGPVSRDSVVTLRPLTEEDVAAVCRLEVLPHQRGYVAPNAVSIAQAYVSTMAWVRVVYADDTPVGFVMLSDDDVKPRYYLWRFMVDARYQGFGFGSRSMELVYGYVRTRPGGDALYLSYVRSPGGPEVFYHCLGFRDTGVVHHGEREAVLRL